MSTPLCALTQFRQEARRNTEWGKIVSTFTSRRHQMSELIEYIIRPSLEFKAKKKKKKEIHQNVDTGHHPAPPDH